MLGAVITQVASLLLEFGADSSAVDAHGALPDDVIGFSCSPQISADQARALSEIIVGHRAKMDFKDGPGTYRDCF